MAEVLSLSDAVGAARKLVFSHAGNPGVGSFHRTNPTRPRSSIPE